MVVPKKWAKTDPRDAKITALTTCLYKLEQNKTYVLEKVQRGGGNRSQARINKKGRGAKKSFVEGLNNIESCRFNK